eukprot:6295489-Amphidinium_carterae.1
MISSDITSKSISVPIVQVVVLHLSAKAVQKQPESTCVSGKLLLTAVLLNPILLEVHLFECCDDYDPGLKPAKNRYEG